MRNKRSNKMKAKRVIRLELSEDEHRCMLEALGSLFDPPHKPDKTIDAREFCSEHPVLEDVLIALRSIAR